MTLSQHDGSWWLTVEDHGIGMAPETMVAALTDFGYSRWQSSEMINDFPGLAQPRASAHGPLWHRVLRDIHGR